MRKVAFITGASKGIGAGTAKVLARHGYDLALNYRSSSHEMEQVADQCRQLGAARTEVFQADISKVAEIDRMFDAFESRFGRELDLLVNNAGITIYRPLLETDEALFDKLTDTDWKGAFFCAKRAARLMKDRGKGGVIVNITSNQQKGCWPDCVVYGPVKAALMHFTEAAALNLAPYDIRVVAVAPGYTASRGGGIKGGPIAERIPLQRFCTPEEVGQAVLYAAGDHAGYITGTCITLDGGALLPVLAENAYA